MQIQIQIELQIEIGITFPQIHTQIKLADKYFMLTENCLTGKWVFSMQIPRKMKRMMSKTSMTFVYFVYHMEICLKVK